MKFSVPFCNTKLGSMFRSFSIIGPAERAKSRLPAAVRVLPDTPHRILPSALLDKPVWHHQSVSK